jgi:hypothetical protein
MGASEHSWSGGVNRARFGGCCYPQAMELLTPDEIGRLSPPERLALIAQL